MYVSFCSLLPPENWSDYLPNKGISLLYLLKNRVQGTAVGHSQKSPIIAKRVLTNCWNEDYAQQGSRG